ncbi:UDP-N-acetyl-D-mannosamine dehydrogenase [Knoellia subterranea]|uniref:UDP-N-acetyl-D-mannosamine dehydrogenase n=1 Tax=Knoellia subterranea KCTC 19937 TaxID=1385521 RepID=A0A0A0JEW4_9MICO|nr:UDP-N-acetyl-D-mannosamine dehydrogenase [Knoellia subterranea]KGN35688.1 UDP-N-acetyl-D-mannosamine dehydrogenase [Knoellia subterranea KCTC 19937]
MNTPQYADKAHTVHNSSTVAVIGLGYIGLPTAAILASNGVKVIGVDVSDKHVDAVNRGEVPFVEPDLATHVAGSVSQGMLSAQKDTPQANTYIVAVPTPFKDGYEADLSYIDAATDGIIPQLRGGELLILESTSPPGATEHMAKRVLDARPDLSLDGSDGRPVVHFAHCPERVLPGRVMIELVTNDRIIGGLTREAAERARDLYQTFCDAELHLTDATTAEMAKLTENSFRDVNIAFANELSVIADRLGIDVFELIELSNKHPRVNILQPGPGVGGHCIAVDPWFIVSAVPEEARLIRTAREVNDHKPEVVLSKVKERADRFKTPVIAALGLAFKPDIDDLRESPALEITKQLAARHADARILAVEPNIDELPTALASSGNVSLSGTEEAIAEADIVVLLVDHKEFKHLDRATLAEKAIIDTRGVWR